MVEAGSDNDAVGGMTNLAGIADEDFKEAGQSSAPTEESEPENPDKSFDSDAMLDDPATVDVIGEKQDVSYEPGKVTKEIIEVNFPEILSPTTITNLINLSVCRIRLERGNENQPLAGFAR